jgi:hypothetical protein
MEKWVRCDVSRLPVGIVTDFAGEVSHVICPYYDSATGQCRHLRGSLGNGPLSDLLGRAGPRTPNRPVIRCRLLR